LQLATRYRTQTKGTNTFLCCIAALLMSGCVSQQSALDFAGTPSPQPVPTGVVLGGGDQTANLQTGQQTTNRNTASNIPTRAPRPSVTVEQSTPEVTVTTAEVKTTVETSPTTSQDTGQILAVAEEKSNQSPTVNVIAAAATPVQPPATNETKPVTAVNDTSSQTDTNTVEVASLSPTVESAPTVEVPEQQNANKQGFFEKLFAPKENGPRPAAAIGDDERHNRARNDRASTRINTANRVSASSTRTATKPKVKRPKTIVATVRTGRSNDGSALPGVKSNNEIFGIKEEQNQVTRRTTQVAALGSLGRLSPNGLRVQHSKVQVACLKPGVIRLLKLVERHYGKKPIITSGYRSPKRNRRAGGARNSQHIFCKAVDIQVEGVSKWKLAKFLRTLPGRGGVGTYCRTKSVHIDIGSVRDWHHPCRKSSKRKRKRA